MFIKLNDRVYLNADRITRVKIDNVQDGIRIRFYEGAGLVREKFCLKRQIIRFARGANFSVATLVFLLNFNFNLL